MTSWTFSGNSQYKTGNLLLYDEPKWLACTGWLIEMFGYIRVPLHLIPLPPIGRIDDGVDKLNYQQYWGDFGHLFFFYAYLPLFIWYETNPNRKMLSFPLTYDRIKELFGDSNPDYFKRAEEQTDDPPVE